MVNVASRLPFGLHNKTISTPHKEGGRALIRGSSSFTPSYSRSISNSSLPTPFSTHMGAHYAPSRSSSTAFGIDQNHSITEDYTENEDEPSGSDSRSRRETPLHPAFNIRIVRGLPGLGPRRGRPKKKVVTENGLLGPDSSTDILSHEDHVQGPAEGYSAGKATPMDTADHASGTETLPYDDEANSSSVLDFKLQDSEPLVVDWDR